jgi:hypothetical protein
LATKLVKSLHYNYSTAGQNFSRAVETEIVGMTGLVQALYHSRLLATSERVVKATGIEE